MGFDKYQKFGAYHWWASHPGFRFWRYSPRADANYVVALRLLEAHLDSLHSANCRVLDLACGDGVMAYRMRRRGLSIVGLDLETLALRYAKEELARRNVLDVALVQGACEALPFSAAVFDGIVVMELIEHLDERSTMALLYEVKRVAKPRGILVLTTPQKQSNIKRSPYHTQEFSASSLKDLLTEHFVDVKILGYLSPRAKRLYAWGGSALRPARLIWKVLWKIGIFNPFTTITPDPSPDWDNLIAVARL